MPRFATIALAGQPNAGKSTLLNALVGESLAAVSSKPQMTRQPVIGIVTEGEIQLELVDLPGLLEPGYLLQHAMVQQAHDALLAADAILYLHPADGSEPPPLEHFVPDIDPSTSPICRVRTKADAFSDATTSEGDVAVSARTGQGLDRLLAWCRAVAKPIAFRYPPDEIGAQPLRFFVTEYVREAAFDVLEQELPYALAVTVDEFRENESPVYIRATLHVERESQKGMVVGKGGRTIKELGVRARRRIETLIGRSVYMDLWVKVWPNWRRSSSALQALGFPIRTEEPT